MMKQRPNDLQEAYEDVMTLFMNKVPVTEMNFGKVVADDLMGYGTTKEEFIRNIREYQRVIQVQEDQSKGLAMDYRRYPIHDSLSEDQKSAIIVEEIIISIQAEDAVSELTLRLSIIMEKRAGCWKMVHFHGSVPVETEEEDTWHLKEWQKEKEKLQKLVDQQTADLQLKNRELEIEAAVERVRAQSMAMHHPDDLDKVNKEILSQLNWLRIDGLTGVTFYLIDQNGWVKAWDFSSPGNLGDQSSYTLQFDSNEYEMLGFPFKTLLQTDLDYFVADYPLEKLEKAVYEFEEIDPAMAKIVREALSTGKLNHQWTACSRISNGLLGIDLVSPPTENTKAIIMKMAGTFNQAYTRFLDLQKAEAQAREAQIQLALERVRARTMAMQKSEELAEVSNLLNKQVVELGIPTRGCAFNIYNEHDSTEWFSNLEGTLPAYKTPRENIFLKYYEAGQRGETLLIEEFGKERIKQHYDYLHSLHLLGDDEDVVEKIRNDMPDSQIDHVAFFKYGYLLFITLEPAPNTHDVFRRFAKEFEQTYTRFLDLEKAEAQAREAQIETSLERVRSRTMAMHKSEELAEVASVLFEQISLLTETPSRFNIAIVREEEKNFDIWVTDQKGENLNRLFVFETEKSDVVSEVFDAWKAGEKSIIQHLSGERLKKWITYAKEAGVPFDKKEIKKHRYINSIFFKHGCIGITTDEVPEKNVIQLLERFTKVFEQTYTRFLDLQKAEAQAREAQIETALERVRARTMGMHQSEELLDVITVVSEQLQQLNFRFDHVSFANNDIAEDYRFWTSAKGLNPVRFNVPYIDIPIFTQLRKAQKSGVKFYTDIITKKENREWHKHLLKHGGSKVFTKEMNNYMMSRGMARSIAIHPNIILILGNYSSVSYSDEDNQVIARFGQVFEQSYTRFLDLKKAEAQTREAKIELSLERIRARVTSMQESSDLLDIVVTMRNEFVNLGHEAQYFWHMRWLPDTYQKAMTSGDGTRIGMIMNLPRHIHGDLQPVANWEKSAEPSYVLAMDVDAAVDYIGKMINLGDFEMVDPQAPSLDDIRHIGGLTFVMARTTHGEIGYSLPGVVTEPPKKDVDTLVRFAGVFDLAYKRFEDLKKAEKDLVEIKEARIKAEKALVELRATQSQLIQSEKMASLGELTAGIAHEIQNPLNFVNNFSEVSSELVEEIKELRSKSQALRQSTGKEARSEKDELEDEILEDIKQNLVKINHHGKRADAIVKGMLAHSRSSSGEKVPTDLNSLADEYLRLSYHGLRAKDKSFTADFSTDFDPGIPKVNVIPQDIGRVLLNLINNAFQAVRQVENPKVMVATKQLDNVIQITVIDNGPGIPDSIKDKIFQPFFTTKPTGQGTGLGLSLSYDIVKAHGGQLEFTSTPGKGSIFNIILGYENK